MRLKRLAFQKRRSAIFAKRSVSHLSKRPLATHSAESIQKRETSQSTHTHTHIYIDGHVQARAPALPTRAQTRAPRQYRLSNQGRGKFESGWRLVSRLWTIFECCVESHGPLRKVVGRIEKAKSETGNVPSYIEGG